MYRLLWWLPLDVSTRESMRSLPVWFHVPSREYEVTSCLFPCSFREGLPTGGSASHGVCRQRGQYPGHCIQGGWADPPPQSEKRAIRIILECFLVGFNSTIRKKGFIQNPNNIMQSQVISFGCTNVLWMKYTMFRCKLHNCTA